MTSGRTTITVQTPTGGWVNPWPNVAEIEGVLPHEYWTLIGGLMVQLHAIHHGIGVVRPTNDVDLIVHVETGRGRPRAAVEALMGLGYRLREPVDPRNRTAHRFQRGKDTVDVVTSPNKNSDTAEVVDVLVADHAAPSVLESLAGHDMVPIEGGTQALRRTINATLTIAADKSTTVSVPDPFGALILKSAAHKTDARDRDRHLLDAAVLLACIDDPYAERERPPSGSDRSRLLHLSKHLKDPLNPVWLHLDNPHRFDAQATLDVLTNGSSRPGSDSSPLWRTRNPNCANPPAGLCTSVSPA